MNNYNNNIIIIVIKPTLARQGHPKTWPFWDPADLEPGLGLRENKEKIESLDLIKKPWSTHDPVNLW
jgi:hypothetical protein